jgi:hypothetical protein
MKMTKKNNGVLDLVPFMSALVTEDAFFAGGDVLHNPEVYVLGNDGVLYQFHQFSLGRSAMTKISDTPIRTNGGKSLLKPYLKPLVNDKKIPIEMLNDIVEFFRQVMKMTTSSGFGHGDYEAMAHIVWNKTKEEYRVAIPKQKVAKASVTYNWDHVAQDEEVVLDIHSHNSMDAFFSGTDERDDATYVGISGVAGKLNLPDHKLIWRFNAYKSKVSMKLEEIFEAPPVKEDSPVVKAWMENVEVLTYQRPSYPGYSPALGGSKVYGGGSRFAGGSDKSLERNPREDSWDARFRGEDSEGLTASARTQRSQASVDILGVDEGTFGIGIMHELEDEPPMSWDETADELVATVYSENDDELNAAVAKRLSEYVADPEVLFQEGIFLVSSAMEARKAIARMSQDFDLDRGI